jgi:hypothetical protein
LASSSKYRKFYSTLAGLHKGGGEATLRATPENRTRYSNVSGLEPQLLF